MRILWASNGPHTNTGYGVPTRHVIKHLKNMGHEVAVQAFYGLHGCAVNSGDLVIYPAQGEANGSDCIGAHAKHFGADLVVTLYDNWAFPLDYGQLFEAPWLSWFPVDGKPVPQKSIARALAADYPAVFSKDGQQLMANAGVEVEYLPYGLDCDVFEPGDKLKARQELGLPEIGFIIVTVAANKGYPARKAWPEILMAFKHFQAMHGDAILYLHTRLTPISKAGIHFGPLLRDLEIPKESIIAVPQDALAVGIDNDDLAVLYQAADVMLLPSMGEGFGLPIAEAQACGCPVITHHCSSMPELTVYGQCIPPLQPFWVEGLEYWWGYPSVERIVSALEITYLSARDASEMGAIMAKRAANYFRENYHWPVVMEKYWKPLLERIEGELW